MENREDRKGMSYEQILILLVGKIKEEYSTVTKFCESVPIVYKTCNGVKKVPLKQAKAYLSLPKDGKPKALKSFKFLNTVYKEVFGKELEQSKRVEVYIYEK